MSCYCSIFLFLPNIYFVHWFFFPVLPQWMSIAGSHLSPLSAGAPFFPESWPETLEKTLTQFGKSMPLLENHLTIVQFHL